MSYCAGGRWTAPAGQCLDDTSVCPGIPPYVQGTSGWSIVNCDNTEGGFCTADCADGTIGFPLSYCSQGVWFTPQGECWAPTGAICEGGEVSGSGGGRVAIRAIQIPLCCSVAVAVNMHQPDASDPCLVRLWAVTSLPQWQKVLFLFDRRPALLLSLCVGRYQGCVVMLLPAAACLFVHAEPEALPSTALAGTWSCITTTEGSVCSATCTVDGYVGGECCRELT